MGEASSEGEGQKLSRRQFFEWAAKALATGVIAAGASWAFLEGIKKEWGKKGEDWGQPLGELGEYEISAIDQLAGRQWPEVRKFPNLKESLGVTKPGLRFEGQTTKGAVYPSWQPMGKQRDEKGNYYGVWLKGTFPLYDGETKQPKVNESGQPVMAEGYIAGHFASSVAKQAK